MEHKNHNWFLENVPVDQKQMFAMYGGVCSGF